MELDDDFEQELQFAGQSKHMPFIRDEPLWHFRHSDVFVDRHVWQRSWLHR